MNAPSEVSATSRLHAALAALPALAHEIGEDAAACEARELPFDGFALFRKSGSACAHLRLNGAGWVDRWKTFHVIATLAAKSRTSPMRSQFI